MFVMAPVLAGYTCTCSDGDWDFYWCDREWLAQNYDTMFLYEHQKILHFRNHYEVTESKCSQNSNPEML